MGETETESEELTMITISSMPVDLLERIERLAKADKRNRSSMINLLLEESVKRRFSKLQAA